MTWSLKLDLFILGDPDALSRFAKSFGHLRLPEPPFDPGILPAHLRRDAGIDEIEVERTRLARAALIR